MGRTAPERLLFLHGRLGGAGVLRPAFHSGPLLQAILARVDAAIVMPEYDRLYGRIADEPRDFDLGPVSATVARAIDGAVGSTGQIDVIAYSYGGILIAKLLRNSWQARIGRLVLIAPVVSYEMLVGAHLSPFRMPTLVLTGTQDRVASASRDVAILFPDAEIVPIEGGNHLYFTLPSPADAHEAGSATITPEEQCERAAEEIVRFLSLPGSTASDRRFLVVEREDGRDTDITAEYFSARASAIKRHARR